MLCVLVDLLGQLVMRVVPLAVLIHHSAWVGGTLIAIVMLFAIGISTRNAFDQHMESMADIVGTGLIFCMTPAFFAMTYQPPYSLKDDLRDFQTTERALLTREGVFMAFAHVSITILASLGLALEGRNAFNTLLAVSASVGLGCMIVGRLLLYMLWRRKPDMFATDATPELTDSQKVQPVLTAKDPLQKPTQRTSVASGPAVMSRDEVTSPVPRVSLIKGFGGLASRASMSLAKGRSHGLHLSVVDAPTPLPPAAEIPPAPVESPPGAAAEDVVLTVAPGRVSTSGSSTRSVEPVPVDNSSRGGDAPESARSSADRQADVAPAGSRAEARAAAATLAAAAKDLRVDATASQRRTDDPTASQRRTDDPPARTMRAERRGDRPSRPVAKPRDAARDPPSAGPEPKNLLEAQHQAALGAWPNFPVGLPLSMALEDDDDDDKATKLGKAAAKKAVAKAEREWHAKGGL